MRPPDKLRTEAEGRDASPMDLALYVWCGLGGTREAARARVAAAMQDLYRIDFERFERYTPYGNAEEVAESLAPYVEAGCREFNVMAVAESPEAEIDGVAEIRRRLAGA